MASAARHFNRIIARCHKLCTFDNAPNPEALKLKYGTHYAQHRLELVPHLHSAGKTHVSLTDVVGFEQFIAWIEENLQ